MMENTIVFIYGEKVGHDLFHLWIRQIHCDIFVDISIQFQAMKELS